MALRQLLFLTAAARPLLFIKALAAGERWITVKPPGHNKGQPLLIKDQPDGSAKVIGGAGGSMNHLRLTAVRSEADYKQEAATRAKLHKEAQKRQTARDKKGGLHESKSAARQAIKEQQNAHQAAFVKDVAAAMGWTQDQMRFPAERMQNASPAEQAKAEKQHAQELFRKAHAAVEAQRKRLVSDSDYRAAAKLGEVPMVDPDPATLSVKDLDPVEDSTKGFGFAPKYGERAATAGLTAEERSGEAQAVRGKPKPPGPDGATPEPKGKDAGKEKVTGQDIAKELEGIREPDPALDPNAVIDARRAVDLLKAAKALKAARASAKEQRKRVAQSSVPVEPKAYQIETGGVAPDAAITKDLENELSTLRTRAFLNEAGKFADGDAIGKHVGVGAYNSINAVALSAGGASLIDRSVIDVLGIAGSAQVLARRLGTDLTPEEMGHLRTAMETFHVDHYMGLSDKALREARDWQEMAHEIEIGEAKSADDLAVAQELNAKRREFTANATRTLGTALGEMEANAALVWALGQPKKDSIAVSLGKTSIETAITQARALGLERGQYQVERVGSSTMLTVTGDGMDRLAQPVSRDDLARTRTALDIIEGKHDEDNWLPDGVARRPQQAMNALPGVAPRLAKPFAKDGAAGRNAEQSIRDYIGGRAADGDSAADIMAGLLNEDTMQRAGDREAFVEALNKVAPLYDADGKMMRAEDHQPAFDAMADQFAERQYGGRLAPTHKQQFEVDQAAVNALHEALAAHPDGVAAFKPIADLTSQDQAALRRVFGEDYGKTDSAAAGLKTDLDKLRASEPARTAQDMFGMESPNPDHADWRQAHDELAGKVNAATMGWGKYLAVMGSPANAYAAMQDVVRSKVLKGFADAHNRAKPGAALKVGRTVIANDLNHLDALDPAARDRRLAEQRDLADRLRNRVAGRYAGGSIADKIDAARATEEATSQSQMGLFGAPDLEGAGDEADQAAPPKPPALGERYTIGHAAERQIAGMMPIVGKNFRPGQPVKLWEPTMSGAYVGRQRAVKLIQHNRRTMLGLGTGSGKTSISLAAFTHMRAAGQAKRGLFVVPSIVQGQFHGEALTVLEPGKFNWHCDPGANREQRIKAYKDPACDFNVVTHQAFRDDMLHLAAQREGTTTDAVSDKLGKMTVYQRRDYMADLMTSEGMDHDYMAVDEGHNLLNRAGKENSRMADVLDGVAHGRSTYVSMTADPVKNDASEAFDVLAKMDPARYSDRDAFMRKYGPDTSAARDGLQREMARHFYTGRIDPGVKANKIETSVALHPDQHQQLAALDDAASRARLARMKGHVDVEALRALSPSSFADADPADHEKIGVDLNRSIGILHNTAMEHAVNGRASVDAVAKLAADRRGRPGVVFAHQLDRVGEIAAKLKAEGHRVVTLTGGDSTAEKDRKKREYQDGKHDVIVMSDAGAVGANLQRGKWLAQFDTPMTSMVWNQRNGRIHRVGQTQDVELHDIIPDHISVRRARQRLAHKHELREVMTSPLEGLDDRGIAGYLSRVKAGQQEGRQSIHAPSTMDRAAIEPDQQASMFG